MRIRVGYRLSQRQGSSVAATTLRRVGMVLTAAPGLEDDGKEADGKEADRKEADRKEADRKVSR